MAVRQSAALDRKKFFGDPVLVVTIVVLILLLTLFIVYPLAILLVDSVYIRDTELYSVGDIAAGNITYYTQSGAEAAADGDAIYAKLAAVNPAEGQAADKLVPLYATTGLFARKARLKDASGTL